MVISVDPGNTKAMSSTSRCYFPTKLSLDPKMEPTGNSHLITFEGKSYIIGEQAEKISFDVSKSNLVHKLATYTAIAKLQQENSIQLTIGCPLSIFMNPELKAEYKRFIMDNQDITIILDGESYSFFIENALILPEGAGVVYVYSSYFRKRRVAVIDLGGLNLNFCIYDNYVPQESSMFTLNHGGYDLQSSIRNSLNSKYALSLNPQDIPHIVRQGGLRIQGQLDSDSVSIVSSLITEYINSIQQEIQRNGFNLDIIDVCFVGGTSRTIQKRLNELVTHAFIPDEPEWVNCMGFYKIGLMKYGQTA